MSTRVTIQPKVPRDVYFRFKQLCHAHDVSVERAIAELMREALERAGVSSLERASKGDRK